MSQRGGGHQTHGHQAHGSHHHMHAGLIAGGLYTIVGFVLAVVGVIVLTLTFVFMGFHPWLFGVIFVPITICILEHDRRVHQRNLQKHRRMAAVASRQKDEEINFLQRIVDARDPNNFR